MTKLDGSPAEAKVPRTRDRLRPLLERLATFATPVFLILATVASAAEWPCEKEVRPLDHTHHGGTFLRVNHVHNHLPGNCGEMSEKSRPVLRDTESSPSNENRGQLSHWRRKSHDINCENTSHD